MSFECKYYLNGHCELRNKKCVPGEKGCVLNAAGAKFIDTTGRKKEGPDRK